MDIIPAHFHKTDRIDERDLIPNNQILADLPESGLEGERIVIEVGTDNFKFYQYLKGDWRKLGGSGQHYTVNANNIVISDLDLDAEGAYKIIVKVTDGTASSGSVGLRINGDDDTNYYTRETIGGSSDTANQTYIPFINSIVGSTPTKYQSEILITKIASDFPLIQLYSTGRVDGTTYPNLSIASSVYNSTTNITSLTFLNVDGTTVYTWDIWIYKLETS